MIFIEIIYLLINLIIFDLFNISIYFLDSERIVKCIGFTIHGFICMHILYFLIVEVK